MPRFSPNALSSVAHPALIRRCCPIALPVRFRHSKPHMPRLRWSVGAGPSELSRRRLRGRPGKPRVARVSGEQRRCDRRPCEQRCVSSVPAKRCSCFFFFLMIRPPPRSPLFPYTPLFRSHGVVDRRAVPAVFHGGRHRAAVPRFCHPPPRGDPDLGGRVAPLHPHVVRDTTAEIRIATAR